MHGYGSWILLLRNGNECIETQNHRMVWVRRDLIDPLVPTPPCHGQGHCLLDQDAQSPVHTEKLNSKYFFKNAELDQSINNLEIQGLHVCPNQCTATFFTVPY